MELNSKQYTFGSRQVGKVSCGYVRNCRLVGSKVGNYTEKEDNYDEDYNPSDEEGEGKKSEHFVKYYNDDLESKTEQKVTKKGF